MQTEIARQTKGLKITTQ